MNTTQYNKAGELQGIIISKHDSNFMDALANAIEIINSHPHYCAYFLCDRTRISISQESGNIVSIRVENLQFINVYDESIYILCEQMAVCINYARPEFIIY